MNKKRIAQILILMMTIIWFAPVSKADTRARLKLLSAVQPSVSIEKSSQSREAASLDVTTGRLDSVLQSVFTLQTNETDENYDFIITSTVQKDGGVDSGYGLNGSTPTLLFTNTAKLPTNADIANAKQSGSVNCNVIAYPVTLILTNGNMSQSFKKSYGSYGDCFVIKVNGETSGTIVHNLGQQPAGQTYKVGQDAAGTYKSTVTFTAVSKL